MHLKGILFDLDGTLADTLPVCVAAFRLTVEQFTGRPFSAAETFALFGRTEEGMLAHVLNGESQAALAHFLAHYERLHETCTAPFPGIPAAVELLRRKGLRLAIVTGKGVHSAAISMRLLGLDRLFTDLETGSPDGPNKGEGINRVLSRWGLPANQVAYVGDTPGDMRAAAVAGLCPFGAAWGANPAAAGVTNAAAAAIDPANPGPACRVFTSVDQFTHWIETELNPG